MPGREVLHHVQRGQHGPVLLFLHCFPTHQAQWLLQLEHFARQYRVIAPDFRGAGRSVVVDPTITVTMEQQATEVIALLDHLGITEPVHLIGLSMGGYVAWQLAATYPERLASMVLCHTRVVADTPEQAQGRHRLAAQTLRERSAEAILSVMVPRLLPESASPEVVERVEQLAREASPEGLAAILRGLAARPDVSLLLPTMQHQCLVISGELDAISPPAEMQAWAAKLPSSRFLSLPGVGHLSPLEAPALFNQTLAEHAPW